MEPRGHGAEGAFGVDGIHYRYAPIGILQEWVYARPTTDIAPWPVRSGL